MLMGESIELTATVYPLNVSQEVKWSISDNKEDWQVAELNGTTLTALKYGLGQIILICATCLLVNRSHSISSTIPEI